MVRKIACCLLVGLLLVAVPTQAHAFEVYAEGNINTTYLSIFEDILAGCPSDSDYVFFRSSQYTYTMIVGDLEYDGTDFYGENVKHYSLQYGGNYSGATYDYNVDTLSSFALTASPYLVYSNLGDFPTIIERGTSYEYALLIGAMVIGICCLVRPVFGFVLRFRNGN